MSLRLRGTSRRLRQHGFQCRLVGTLLSSRVTEENLACRTARDGLLHRVGRSGTGCFIVKDGQGQGSPADKTFMDRLLQRTGRSGTGCSSGQDVRYRLPQRTGRSKTDYSSGQNGQGQTFPADRVVSRRGREGSCDADRLHCPAHIAAATASGGAHANEPTLICGCHINGPEHRRRNSCCRGHGKFPLKLSASIFLYLSPKWYRNIITFLAPSNFYSKY